VGGSWSEPGFGGIFEINGIKETWHAGVETRPPEKKSYPSYKSIQIPVQKN
jgi:hypothetical protein